MRSHQDALKQQLYCIVRGCLPCAQDTSIKTSKGGRKEGTKICSDKQEKYICHSFRGKGPFLFPMNYFVLFFLSHTHSLSPSPPFPGLSRLSGNVQNFLVSPTGACRLFFFWSSVCFLVPDNPFSPKIWGRTRREAAQVASGEKIRKSLE